MRWESRGKNSGSNVLQRAAKDRASSVLESGGAAVSEQGDCGRGSGRGEILALNSRVFGTGAGTPLQPYKD